MLSFLNCGLSDVNHALIYGSGQERLGVHVSAPTFQAKIFTATFCSILFISGEQIYRPSLMGGIRRVHYLLARLPVA